MLETPRATMRCARIIGRSQTGRGRHILTNPKPRPRRGQRGFVLVLSGILLLTMFALMVVAIDIGRISHTGTEVQGIADSAALAGALAVIKQGPGNARPAATTAAQDNRFDGRDFVNDGTNGQLDVIEGSWDTGSASFTPGGSPTNAVRAITTGRSVRYVTAPMIGIGATTDIQRLAVAVIGAPVTGAVSFPGAVCSNVANGVSPQPPGPCAGGDGTVIKTIPDLQQTGTQNSCFSGLGTGASSSNERNLLPARCGGTTVATVSVGQIIFLDNGQNATVLQALQSCVGPAQGGNANNVHRFILPVIDNCSCSGASLPVAGFVEIEIDDPSQVITTGSNKRITGAKQICDSQLYGGGITLSGDDFGVKETRLAR